jgi:glutaredoxin
MTAARRLPVALHAFCATLIFFECQAMLASALSPISISGGQPGERRATADATAPRARIVGLGRGPPTLEMPTPMVPIDRDTTEDDRQTYSSSVRRNGIAQVAATLLSLVSVVSRPSAASAAPPVDIIAQELGYFPVTNKKGKMVYVPKSIYRSSTPQAIELAKRLHERHAVMYGAYWCPHCARQRELLGREALNQIQYVECANSGYNAVPQLCQKRHVDGFPTWILNENENRSSRTVRLSGEQTLDRLAAAVDFEDFDVALEPSLPSMTSGPAACR